MKTVNILAVRHMPHKNNIVSPEDLVLAFELGARLRRYCETYGIRLPSAWWSSPQCRAVDTGLAVLKGMGTMPALSGVDEGIGDLVMGKHALTPDEVGDIKNKAAAAKESIDDFIFTEQYAKLLRKRGLEGAECCYGIVRATAKSIEDGDHTTVLIASHGGRIEPMVACMADEDVVPPKFKMATGTVVYVKAFCNEFNNAVAFVPPYHHLGNIEEAVIE